MMRALALLPFFALFAGCGGWAFSYGNGKDLRTPLEKAAQEGDVAAVKRGLNLNAVDENGRNELHTALAPPVVPPVEGIEYLIRAGVPLNARDRSGKTPLAYWREPRDYERYWVRSWLIDRLAGDSPVQRERENRAKVSALLERSDRKSTRLNSSHPSKSRMPSSA